MTNESFYSRLSHQASQIAENMSHQCFYFWGLGLPLLREVISVFIRETTWFMSQVRLFLLSLFHPVLVKTLKIGMCNSHSMSLMTCNIIINDCWHEAMFTSAR